LVDVALGYNSYYVTLLGVGFGFLASALSGVEVWLQLIGFL